MSAQRPLALVTGGLRRIGAAIAASLAQAGHDLILHSHKAGEPEPGLADTLGQSGAVWSQIVADLADADIADQLLGHARTRFGRMPDLIVCNAGLFEDDDARTVSASSLDRHFRVNVHAPVLLASALAKQHPGPASLVFIVDQRVRNPVVDQLSYSLSKMALAESIRVLARALAPGIRVNGVAPGLTLPTPDYDDAQWQALEQMMPLDRLAKAQDIADAVLYLDQAKSVTGQLLFVDGGAHMDSYHRDFVHLGKSPEDRM